MSDVTPLSAEERERWIAWAAEAVGDELALDGDRTMTALLLWTLGPLAAAGAWYGVVTVGLPAASLLGALTERRP